MSCSCPNNPPPTLLSPSKASMCVATLSRNQRSCEMTNVLPAKLRIASSRHLAAGQAGKAGEGCDRMSEGVTG